MGQFKFEAFDQSGGRVTGTVEAETETAAAAELRERGLLLKQLAAVGAETDWRTALGLGERRVGLADLEFLTAELSLLLDSGVRIDRAVDILQRAGKGGAVSRLLRAMALDIKQGKQLSEAAASHPDVFDNLYINLVSIGEAGGKLPEVFRGLAGDLRFRRELQQKVVSAAVYPLVVAGVCVVALVFILNFVVPNLESIFADAQDLPWYTALLLSASDFMVRWQWPLLLVLVGGATAIWRMRASPGVVEFRDRMLLEIPFLREATAMVERIRYCGGLGLMLDAGIPVDKALSLATGNVRHGVLKREMQAAVEKVKRGEQLSGVLRQTRLFPSYFASLLEVGEEGGELAKVFNEIARRSRDEFSAWALRLTTILEPLLIVIMGVIVGGVVVIMMLSITSVADVELR
jgi:general secretion pathway protein F